MALLWETCRLVYELSNERTVVIMNQQCNITHTDSEGHVTGTDLANIGATVMSLVQTFRDGFKEDAL